MTPTWQDIGTEGRPVRIQRKRAKGWKMPANTVCVDRATRWGNPFKAGLHYDQQHAVDLFRMFFVDAVNLRTTDKQLDRLRTEGADVQQFVCAGLQVGELRGKNLACWCPLDRPCHAEVLLELANLPSPPSKEGE